MNINQLKAFVGVIETGTFSAAAKQVGISQPAVSLQIQALEEYLGVHLLDRTTKRVELTEAGQIFYPIAREIIDKITEAQRQLEELGESVKGRLAVGGSTIPGQYILPKVLGIFSEKYPEVTVSLKISDSAAVAEQIINGDLQVGLIGANLGSGQLNSRSFVSDELVLIVPARHRLAKKGRATLKELSKENFIIREKGSGTRFVTENYLLKQGSAIENLNIVMELGSSEAVVSAVASGLGISIVSKWAAEKALKLGEVAIVKLPGPPIIREIFLVYSKHALTRSTQAFLSFLEGFDLSAITP
jgi:DNA-binding transcriptional LysR family regulator